MVFGKQNNSSAPNEAEKKVGKTGVDVKNLKLSKKHTYNVVWDLLDYEQRYCAMKPRLLVVGFVFSVGVLDLDLALWFQFR